MRKLLLAITFIACLASFTIAQNHGSCDKAILIDTSSYGPVYADGIPNPLLAQMHTNGTYFEKPHIAVWFCIDIPYDTLLTFDLVPQNPTDDLDFLLFKDETAEIKNCTACRGSQRNFCDKSALVRMIPMRTNIANTYYASKGTTGLSVDSKNEMEPPGKHATYSKALPVKKDERYYLVVDNYTSAKRPFTLIIHFKFPANAEHDTVINGGPSIDNSVATTWPKGVVPIYVQDSTTKAPVKAKIKIEWIIPKTKPGINTTASKYGLELKQGQKINITCAAKGYLLAQLTYQALTDTAIYVNMLQIKEHMKMIFKHIEFERGEAKFLSTSAESLNDLLEFMNNNPTVKILIKGYVNDPYQYYDYMYDLDLSKLRAQAVYNYLAGKGIEKNRLDWKGLGNKEMVYPKPSNEDEMEANRRVEVEIVK